MIRVRIRYMPERYVLEFDHGDGEIRYDPAPGSKKLGYKTVEDAIARYNEYALKAKEGTILVHIEKEQKVENGT